ncbi:MAG: ZIP family metal transporter [bacterium]
MVYLLPFVAIIIGYVIALLISNKKFEIQQYLLAFSGSFLLSITLFELLPEIFEQPSKQMGVFIMVGILLQIILDFITKGAEHGHVHVNEKSEKFPWLLFIGLSIHSIIEGFPVIENTEVLWGVVIHKVPIALILTIYFIAVGFSKMKTIIFLILFALMTPLGSYLANTVSIFSEYKSEINAIAIGIFLHVSTTILFESSKNHKFNLMKLSSILIGTVIAYLI